VVGGITRRTARNAAVSVAADLLGKASSLLWTVLAARMLGQADFGAFFFALTLSLLLSGVAEWAFDSVMVERGSRDRGQLPVLFSQAMAWQTSLAVPLFIAGGVVASSLRASTSVRMALALVLLATLLDMWNDSARAVAAAIQTQATTARALIGQRIATAVLISIALLVGGGLVSVAATFCLASAIGLVLHLRAIARLGVRFSFGSLTRTGMISMLGQSGLIGPTSLVLMVLFRLDAILLGLLVGDEAVAAYAAAYKLLETCLFVAFALRSSLFPVMTASGTAEVARVAVERGLAAMSVLYVPFAIVSLVEPHAVLALLYGSSYADQSTTALRWLAFAPLLFGMAFLSSAALQARRRYGAMLIAAAAATVLNVAMNLVLIPQYAGTAAAAATTVAYAVQAGAALLALRGAQVRVRVARPLLETGVAGVLLTGALVASPLPVLLEVPLGGVLFLACWIAMARWKSPEQLRVLAAVVPGRGRQ